MITILQGDVIEQLRTLPDESVHCCVTSPPYWGLRDYSTNGQIGLEKTPEEYVAKMVEVFREFRRVLRKDGTLWLNLGDSYASTTKGSGTNSLSGGGTLRPNGRSQPQMESQRMDYGSLPIKQKDLVGIPWRVAFALQADGWWLRSDIIWAKPNPMPESVTDRPTKAHEYLFLFAKGDWRQRPIKFADLPDERVHFVNHRWEQVPAVGKLMLGSKAVQLATTLLDCTQSEYDFCLPPFYDEVWRESPDGSDSSFVSGLPMKHWSAVWANRFLASQCSTKRFLQELQGLFVSHPAAYHLLKSWVVSQLADSPHIYCDSDGSLTINESGQICEFQIVQGQIITAKPSDCNYFYDAEAIREVVAPNNKAVQGKPQWFPKCGPDRVNGTKEQNITAYDRICGANKRSVWTVATAPYPEAHFATYPPDLIKPCILAGTSAKGCCAKCGSPWERIVEKSGGTWEHRKANGEPMRYGIENVDVLSKTRVGESEYKTIVWQPTCECNLRPLTLDERQAAWAHDDGELGNASSETTPCTVLDPFAGSGTTGAVALELGRKAVLIELNPKYVELIKHRCNITPGLQLAV